MSRGVGHQQRRAPAGEARAQGAADGAVERAQRARIAEAPAVGRVHDAPCPARAAAPARRAPTARSVTCAASPARSALLRGGGDGRRRAVAADDRRRRRGQARRLGLVVQRGDSARRRTSASEAKANSRCRPGARRMAMRAGLERQRAGAAHRVDERRRRIPAAQEQQRRGQRLAQRRVRDLLAPAATVQQLARAVDADGADVGDAAREHLLRLALARAAARAGDRRCAAVRFSAMPPVW